VGRTLDGRLVVSVVIDDRDVWQAALLLVKRYGDDAMLEASERADQLLDEGGPGLARNQTRKWPHC
jgi:hypothetical protein